MPLNEAWVVEIKGLDYPRKQPENIEELLSYSAVQLFLLAARRAVGEYQLNKSDLPAVSRVTQLLEGMPLGLELAATWTKMLSCQGIADEFCAAWTSWKPLYRISQNDSAVSGQFSITPRSIEQS